MNATKIALIVGAFFTGIFAGLMFTFSLVIQRMLVTLNANEYTRIMQQLIQGADNPPIVPAIVMIALAAPLYALVKLRRHRDTAVFRLTLIGWLAFLIGAFLVTVGFNAPINNAIAGWQIQSPPADWMQVRDRWNSLNIIRTPLSILSFLFYLCALAYPLPEER